MTALPEPAAGRPAASAAGRPAASAALVAVTA